MGAVWKIEVGRTVINRRESYEIAQILDLKTVLGKNLKTGKFETLRIAECSPPEENNQQLQKNNSILDEKDNSKKSQVDLGTVPDEKWKKANARAEAVKKLLQLPKITVADVDEQAKVLGVSRPTLYRYLNKFAASEKTSALIPNASDGGRGKTRISENSETILQTTINEYYLTKQNPKIQKVIREYKRRCYNAGVEAAHDNTVRNRIALVSEIDRIKNRRGRSAARRLEATPGGFPEGKFPLEVAQIDHTPIDLQFVDDITRQPIGRLWLTVLIDIFSRMILGFYISPDAPGSLPVGMTLIHAFLPKDTELARLEVDGEWNTWGLVNKIHADNAGEFRGHYLRRVCQEYDIDLEWRPVGRPHFGAHIERLLGTFMQEVHLLPGTTFSNIEKRGEYDSEKEAVFTYGEFEKWLTTYIVGVYHKTVHDGIGMPPEVMYERGLLVGSDKFPGRGVPPLVVDEQKLRIDFLPSVERTIQQHGVDIDLIHYYDPVLNPFIGAKDKKHPKLARKFIFKRNPRRLQKIYFYHPDLHRYFEIPYRNLTHPDMTLWELNAARKKLKEEGRSKVSEDDIFAALNSMKRIENNAQKETKKARRDSQKKRIYEQQKLPSSKTKSGVSNLPLDKNSSNPPQPANQKSLSSFFNMPEDEIVPLEVEED